MTFLRYFAAKEVLEIAKNERIRPLSSTVENDVEEQDENDDDEIMEDMNVVDGVQDVKDDVIKGKDELDANSNTSNSKSVYSMEVLIFLNAKQI